MRKTVMNNKNTSHFNFIGVIISDQKFIITRNWFYFSYKKWMKNPELE